MENKEYKCVTHIRSKDKNCFYCGERAGWETFNEEIVGGKIKNTEILDSIDKSLSRTSSIGDKFDKGFCRSFKYLLFKYRDDLLTMGMKGE